MNHIHNLVRNMGIIHKFGITRQSYIITANIFMREAHTFIQRTTTPIETSFVGLGTEADYRSIVKLGLMKRYTKETGRGVKGWYVFTPKGLELYKKLYP